MYKKTKLLVPVIEVVEKRLIDWGFPKNKVPKYLGRVLLCLDTLKQKKGGIHSSFFEPLCGRITIEGQKYNFVQILLEAKLIKKVGKYKRGILSQKYKVIPPCTKQTIEVPKRDLKRLENALEKLSGPKSNKALGWLNKKVQHVSKDGVYVCTEALPRNWEAILLSDIWTYLIERRLKAKIIYLSINIYRLDREKLNELHSLQADYILLLDYLEGNEPRLHFNINKALIKHRLAEADYCQKHLRNIVDDICRVARKKYILLATDGFQIKAEKIPPLRDSINGYLIRKGFNPINSSKNHKHNPQALYKEDLQAMVVSFDEAIQSLAQFIGWVKPH